MAFDVSRTNIEISATDKTKVAFDSIKSSIGNLTSQFGGLTGLLGAGAFVAFTKRIIDQADSMNDLSKRTGIAVEQIGAWRLATEQSGTSMDALTAALGKGSKYLVQHGDDLKKIGINAKTSEELILQLSGVISKMPADDPRRTALAMQVLGKSAGELIPLLSEGEAGLRKMLERGRELNPYLEEMAQKSDAFNDNLAELKVVSSDLAVSFVGGLLPSLNQILQKMIEVSQQGGVLKGVIAGVLESGKQVFLGNNENQGANKISGVTKRIIADQKIYADLVNNGQSAQAQALLADINVQKTALKALILKQSEPFNKKNENAALLSGAQSTSLNGFLKTDGGGTAKRDATAERIKALSVENTLLSQGKTLEEARTIARLQADGASKKQIEAVLSLTLVQNQFEEAQKTAEKTQQDLKKATEDHAEAMRAMLETAEEAVISAQRETAESQRGLQVMQLGESAVIRMEAARLNEAAASAEQGLAYAKLNGLSQENIDFTEVQILRLRELAKARFGLADSTDATEAFEKEKDRIKELEKEQIEAAKRVADDQKQNARELSQALTSGLFDSFKKGESFGKSMLKNLAALAKTWAARLFDGLLTGNGGTAGLLGGLFSGSANASPLGAAGDVLTGKGGGSIFGQLSSIGDIFSKGNNAIVNGIGSIGQSLSAFGAGGSGIFRDIASSIGSFTQLNSSLISNVLPFAGAAFSLLKGDFKGAALTGIGTLIGGPIGGALGSLVGSLFGSKKQPPRQSGNASVSFIDGKLVSTNGKVAGRTTYNSGLAGGVESALSVFSSSLGGLLKAFGGAGNVTASGSYTGRAKGSAYYGLSTTADGISSSFSQRDKKQFGEANFKAYIDRLLGVELVNAIQRSKLPEGIRQLFDGLTENAQINSMINASVALNDAQAELASRFGLTVDAAGKVSSASGKAGEDLAKFANSITAAALATRTVGASIVKGRDELLASFNNVFGDVVTEAVLSTVEKQVPITTTAPKANGILGALGIGGINARPATSGIISGFAGISSLNKQVQQFKTVTEQVTTYIDKIVSKNLALPKTLQEYDDLLKSIDKTSASGQKMFADVFALRDQFAAIVGTVDSLKGGVKGSLFNVSSEAEKQAILDADLAKLFGDLGRTVPASVQELIALGKSIDYTTVSGLDLAASFPTLVDAFTKTKGGVDGLTDGLDSLLSTLRDESGFKTLFDFNFYKGIAGNYGNEFANKYIDGAQVQYGASNNTSVSLPTISPSNNTTISTSDPNMLNAMTTLTATVKSLEAQLASIKTNTRQTADVLRDAVSPTDGVSLQTVVMP